MTVKQIHRAMVTGASSGLGDAYVRRLAENCTEIVAVARRGDRLRALRETLAPTCDVIPLVADLGSIEGQARVVEAIRQGPPLGLLINNAGFSTLGPFSGSELDRELDMLRLHEMATLALTRAALPAMIEASRGAIVNVASVAGLLAMPEVATYGATKAFLVSFSRSLRAELASTDLQVQCLCPGYTRTEIHSRPSFSDFDASRVPQEYWMEAEEVVRESLEALADGAERWFLVPGQHNRDLVRRGLTELLEACV